MGTNRAVFVGLRAVPTPVRGTCSGGMVSRQRPYGTAPALRARACRHPLFSRVSAGPFSGDRHALADILVIANTTTKRLRTPLPRSVAPSCPFSLKRALGSSCGRLVQLKRVPSDHLVRSTCGSDQTSAMRFSTVLLGWQMD